MYRKTVSIHQGFTLIELTIVLVILSLLAAFAAPKFLSLKDDAQRKRVAATAAAFKSGVDLAHAGWAVKGASSSGLFNLSSLPAVTDPYLGITSKLDLNGLGWPVGIQEDYTRTMPDNSLGSSDTNDSISINNTYDCEQLWLVLVNSSMTLALAQTDSLRPSSDFYVSGFTTPYFCTYALRANANYSFTYSASSGIVTPNVQ